MAEERLPVFVVTLEATEGGRPASVLAFAQAATEAAGEAMATAELQAFGWTGIRVLRTAELIDEAALPGDFQGALDNARAYGCGLIIYDEP